MTTIEELKLCAENWHSKHPTRTLILNSISQLEALQKQSDELGRTIVSQHNEINSLRTQNQELREALQLAKEMTQPGYHGNAYKPPQNCMIDLHGEIDKALALKP